MSDAAPPIFTLSESQPWYKKAATRWLAVAGLVVLILLIWHCSKAAFADVRIAKQAVDHFHQHFNAGQFENIYDEASDQLHNVNTKAQFVELFSAIQRKLGSVVRTGEPRYVVNANTNGTSVTLTYQTEFTNGSAEEKFVWSLKGGEAILNGYTINSRELVVK